MGLLVSLGTQQWVASSPNAPSTTASKVSSIVGTSPFRPHALFNLMTATAVAVTQQQHHQETIGTVGGSGFDEDRDMPLMADLELLSNILSDLVDHEDPAVHSLYESFRQLGIKRSTDTDNSEPLKQLVQAAGKLTPAQAIGVTRTFSIMLNLINAAEVHHRFRRLKQNERIMYQERGVEGPLPALEDSIRGTIEALLKTGEATPNQIMD